MDIPPSKTPLFGPYEIAFLQSIEKTDERQSIVIKEKKTFQVHQPQKKHDTKHSKYMEVVSISASPKTLKGHSRYSLERFGTVSLNPLKNHGSMRCGDF